jgi:iron complex transport system substrate-binding protein
MSRHPFRLAARLIALLVALLAVAGCGSDDGEPSGGTTPTAADAFPVTIAQADGDVTIEAEPRRVVALDFPSADAALALGVVPVGTAEISYLPEGMHRWTAEALDGATPEVFAVADGYPLEEITALDPDVILAVGNAYPPVGDSWEALNAIAPVVTSPHGQGSRDNTWQEGHLQVGRALGQADRAAEQVAEVEAKMAEARDANPAFAGKSVTFFNYAAGVLYLINSNDDTSIRFLRDLGFAGISANVAAMPDMAGSPGRAEVSPEQYSRIEADLILGTSSDGRLDDLTAGPTFSRIPAVERGAFLGLDVGRSTSMVYPSVLSLTYAVEDLTPEMAAALGG